MIQSVRASETQTGAALNVTEARLDIRRMPLFSIILFAFSARDYEIAAPDWLKERQRTFDIQATFQAGSTRDQVRHRMTMSELADLGCESPTDRGGRTSKG